MAPKTGEDTSTECIMGPENRKNSKKKRAHLTLALGVLVSYYCILFSFFFFCVVHVYYISWAITSEEKQKEVKHTHTHT